MNSAVLLIVTSIRLMLSLPQMSRCKARSNPYAGKTVFCTVRNPVERLLSEMRWRMLQCSWDEPFVTEYIEQPFNVTCKTKDRIREGLKGKQLVEAIAYCKRKRIIRKRRDTKERKIGKQTDIRVLWK